VFTPAQTTLIRALALRGGKATLSKTKRIEKELKKKYKNRYKKVEKKLKILLLI